jgi:hypothetical protein
MTDTEINTVNAVPDEDDNAEQHTGDRIPDHDDTSPIDAANDQFAADLDAAMGGAE